MCSGEFTHDGPQIPVGREQVRAHVAVRLQVFRVSLRYDYHLEISISPCMPLSGYTRLFENLYVARYSQYP